MKKTLFTLFTVLAVVILYAVSFGGIEARAETRGTTGDCIWVLSESTLIISGDGPMADYYKEDLIPWGKNIREVIIQDGVTNIGTYAFYNCGGISSITIPDSVTSIGDYAFEGCERLTSISISSGVTSIGAEAFSSCGRLEKINVSNNNSFYCDIDGVLFNKEKTEILEYPSGKTESSYVVPDSVKSIGVQIFNGCTSLTSITIGDGVTSIGDRTFSFCSNVKSVTIGNNVTSIGDSAFDYCSNLTNITIPNSVNSIGGSAFYNCSSLTSINIPDSVTSIGDWAFYGCSSLTSINIPDSVTSIGTRAFSHVKTANFTRNIDNLNIDTFSSSNLKTVNFGGTLAEWEAMVYSGDEQFSNATIICTCLDNAHVYDNASDYTCNACDYTKDPCAEGHSYKTTWSNDGSKHWHECSVCSSKKDESTHTYDNACDTTCNTCGYARTITHSYKTIWDKDSTNHWHECSVCSAKKDEATHTYDNACDTTCNVCGYTRTVTHSYQTTWSKDSSKHWHACSVCGAKKDEASHTPGVAATENTAQTCTACGYVIQAALGHTHSYGSAWEKDINGHWHECSCGSRKDEGTHTYDGGKVTKEPTVDEEGVKTYACTACGATKTEAMAKLPPATTENQTTPEDTTPPDESTTPDSTTAPDTTEPDVTVPETTDSEKGSGKKDNTTTVVIIIVASALALGGVGTALALILKKKK